MIVFHPSSLTVCAFDYDVFYDLILKVSINKNLLILSVANGTAQSYQYQCTKAMFSILWFRQEEQNSEFPKSFFGGYLFVFVKYLCNCSPKIKTKNIKNYFTSLALL